MHNSKQTGYAKNVARFELIREHCRSFGAAYNPARSDLSLAALDFLLEEGRGIIEPMRLALDNYAQAVAARAHDMNPLEDLIKRSFESLQASGCSPETLVRANAILHQYRGAGKASSDPSDLLAESLAPHSHLHRHTRDTRIEWLDQYLELLRSEPLYRPHEPELGLENLEKWRDKHLEHNTKIRAAAIARRQARNERDRVVYAPRTGMVAIAAHIKAYVRATFGPKSREYRAISSLRFIMGK